MTTSVSRRLFMYNVQDYSLPCDMLYARIVNFLTRGKHILDRNILLRGEKGGGA